MRISAIAKKAMAKTANVTVKTMKVVGPVVKTGLTTTIATVVIPTVAEHFLKKWLNKLEEEAVKEDLITEHSEHEEHKKVYRSASEWLKDHPGETLSDKIYDEIYGGPSGNSVDLNLIYADYERRYGQ